MRHFLIILFICPMAFAATAQEDLLSELQKNHKDSSFVLQTFKGTRLVNGHSVETKPAGTLEFIISHRFGTLNSGIDDFFGLDISTIRLGLEYGITDRAGIGIGRSSLDKSFDSYIKYKVLRQGPGMPVTISAVASAYAITSKSTFPEVHGVNRIAYGAQLLVARKFETFSLQVAPVFLHRNAVVESEAVHDLMAIGTGGRIRLTRSLSLHAEYYARLNEKASNDFKNSFGLALDIETGGHVFQLVFTNTRGMMDRIMLTETSGDFFGGDIHFGFNITRTFQLSGKGKTW